MKLKLCITIDISVLSNMQKQQKVAEKINKKDPGFEILIETIEKKTIYFARMTQNNYEVDLVCDYKRIFFILVPNRIKTSCISLSLW